METSQAFWHAPAEAEHHLCLFDSQAGTWLTRGELAREVEALARLLAPLTPCLALCYCANQISTIVAYLACLQAKLPVLLLDARTAQANREEMERRYQPELIFESAQDTPFDRAGYQEAEALGRGMWLWRRAGEAQAPPHPDLALLLTTSGSTGSPKLVRLSLANLQANARSIALALELGPAETAITSLPLHYSFGLSLLNSHLWAGGSLVVTTQGALERPFWKLFNEQGCTSFAGVPFLYHLLERIGFSRMELPSLRTMTQAGGRLAVEVIQRFHELLAGRNQRFVVMYGQTEATARMACLPPADLPRKLGSVGLAIDGGRFTIRNEQGRVLPAGQEGEIIYQGPNVMLGYALNRDDLARGDDQQGLLATGDLGNLDQEGYLYVTGRLSRFSKIYGLRVNLDDVESWLSGRGPTAVVGNDDKILIYCCHGQESDFQEYARELAARLKVPYQVFNFRRVETFPQTPSGKLDYKTLEEGL